MIVTDPTKVDGWLRDGLAISEVMRRSSWGRAQITARAASIGLVISPNTDKARAKLHDEPDTDEQERSASLKDAARSIMEQRRNGVEQPSPRPTAPTIDPYAELLAKAAQSPEKRTRATAARLIREFKMLQERLDRVAAAERIQAEIAQHQRQILELREKAKGTGLKMHTASAEARPWSSTMGAGIAERNRKRYADERALFEQWGVTRHDVRDWGIAHGFEVSIAGFLRRDLIDAYAASREETAS